MASFSGFSHAQFYIKIYSKHVVNNNKYKLEGGTFIFSATHDQK